MGERWRPLHNEGYQVSDLGRVRNPAGEYIELVSSNRPTFYLDGHCKKRRVDEAVLGAFVGPRPNGYEIVHVSGVGYDCRLANLEYRAPIEYKPKTATVNYSGWVVSVSGTLFYPEHVGRLDVPVHGETVEVCGITRRIGEVVLEAFCGPKPRGYVVVWRDGDAANNALCNLEYRKPRKGNRRLTDAQVLKIYEIGNSQPYAQTAAQFGLSSWATVRDIVKGKAWRHLTQPDS